MHASLSLRRPRGFTLVEIMVATVIMVILMGIIFQLTASMADIWRSTAGKIGAFQGARAGFDALSRGLEQATLMTYLDYVNDDSIPQPRSAGATTFVPKTYARASELHFVSGPSRELVPGANANNTQGHAVFFQAPLGVVNDTAIFGELNEVLNAVGFYVEYTDDKGIWPNFIQGIMGSSMRYRFRLMQWIQPSEQFRVYQSTKPVGVAYSYNRDWFVSGIPNIGSTSVAPGQVRPRMIAENIIAIFIRPRFSAADEDLLDDGLINDSATGGRLAPSYRYDSRSWSASGFPSAGPVNLRTAVVPGTSPPLRLVDLMRNQLPPLLDLVVVAIDPKDADRLCRQESIPDVLRIPANTFDQRSATNAADFLFQPDGSGQSDVEKYEAQLGAAGVNFRSFKSTLTIKGAKWSIN
jgi:uncharacterized protein (TIGR02599 family)